MDALTFCATPVPVKFTEEPPPLAELKTMAAVRVPEAVGMKVTVTLQLLPPANVPVQSVAV